MSLDPALVARTFGAVVPVDEPLPETSAPLVHAEDDDDLPIDTIAAMRLAERPATLSLLSIASTRLTSIKPQSAPRKKEISRWLGRILEPLKALDEFVATLESEHFAAVEARWEFIHQEGRKIADSLPGLQAEVGSALGHVNQANEQTGHRATDLQQAFQDRRQVGKWAWATADEIKAADQKLERAKAAAESAAAKAWEAQKALAAAESRLATARANLKLHAGELKRLSAEFRGLPYHDPATGLTVDPKDFQDPTSTKNLTDKIDRHYGARQ